MLLETSVQFHTMEFSALYSGTSCCTVKSNSHVDSYQSIFHHQTVCYLSSRTSCSHPYLPFLDQDNIVRSRMQSMGTSQACVFACNISALRPFYRRAVLALDVLDELIFNHFNRVLW